MRGLLLATAASLAALTALSAPASAQSSAAQGFSASNGSPFGNSFVDGDRRRDDRRRRRDGDGDIFIGEWPQQGDTAWRSNSYNDWWHDRPDRAYPAWVQRNQNCERLWWSGGNWRC